MQSLVDKKTSGTASDVVSNKLYIEVFDTADEPSVLLELDATAWRSALAMLRRSHVRAVRDIGRVLPVAPPMAPQVTP